MLACTSRLFVRGIVRYVDTTRDPALFSGSVAARSGELSGSALLAYKLNWQSVLFVGYGDDRELSDARRLEPVDRQFFVKLSYAFQRYRPRITVRLDVVLHTMYKTVL